MQLKDITTYRLAEAEMKYRTHVPCSQRAQVHNSACVFELMRPLFDECMDFREEFWVLMLDRGNRAKGAWRASQGGMHGTVADPKLIFAAALKCLASSIVLCHNHPSGQIRPSEEDVRLTRKLVEAGRFLELPIRDHLIITREGYYSFADNGQL